MDKFLLEYEMKKKGYSVEKLCKEIGVSRSAFYKKCNGKSDFTQSEIQAIVKLLQLDSPVAIFFAQ